MQQIRLMPTIYSYKTCKEFSEALNIGKEDLIITNEYIYGPMFGSLNIDTNVLYQEKYGTGEPSDEMVEAIYSDIEKTPHKRIIAIGGGTIIDIAKLFALENVTPVLDLFDRKLEIAKAKELILVPTTCGTGSEVTNISILELKSRKTKLGLAVDEMYADAAVMIPELLKGLPFKFFATSSIDALIHAVESSVSPKASVYTEMFSYGAIEMILNGYKKIAANGEDARFELLEDFLIASNYAGIAFGNAGCAAVHAMSYPLGARYHVPHGEANYAIFTEVFKAYIAKQPVGKIQKLNKFIADLLECDVENVYDELENLLNHILPKKALSEYGVTEENLVEFTDNVMEKQGRLMANNYVELLKDDVYGIYKRLY